jgi:hypothetical protein
MTTFDHNAPATIVHLNYQLSQNTTTRLLTARMTQKSSILDAFGRYIITSRQYTSLFLRNSTIDDLTRPDSLLLDSEEVVWGTDSLADFETEVSSYLDNVTLPVAA